jgi:serine protease Do
MSQNLRQNAKWLFMVTTALAISVGLASGVGDRSETELPPLRTPAPQPVVAVSREVRSALNLSDAFTSIAASITPGVVRIESEHTPEPRRLLPRRFQQLLEDDSTGSGIPEIAGGSGFIVSEDGYIVTNNHVVEGADLISVRLYDKRTLPARLVGRDPFTDVALLKIEAKNLAALRFGDSDQANVGEWVLAIGNPGFGEENTLDFTVTSGIISAKGRPLEVLTRDGDTGPYAIEDFIQTDAAINPGNSGGPLLNLKGEVVGVNTAIASTTGFNEGYAFAIPANLVQRVMKDLAEFGNVRRPLLGVRIRDATQEDADFYRLPEISGVLIEDFSEDSPADAGGLQRGDVIVQVDGRPVDRVGQLQRLVAEHRPNEFVQLRVYRSGAPQDFRIKLTQAPLPVAAVEPNRRRSTPGAGLLGIQVVELTDQLARSLGFRRSGGAVITEVQAMSAAARKRVVEPARIVSINGVEIKSAREAQSRLRTLRSGQIVSLILERPDQQVLIRNIRVP